jgi:hypothetical protein
MDTLNSAPTGGGNFGFAMDRANSAVGAANANQANPFGAPAGDPFGNPFGAPAGDPFGNPFGAPAGDPFGGGGAQPNPFGAQPNPFGAPTGFGAPSFAPVAQATLSAWGGERVICHRTGQILQDAREINILVSQVGSYYDDGENGNDAVAGDNIYTNITISRDFISPEAHLIKTRLVQTLQYASELTPMEFTLERVATTEPLSGLPKVVTLEEERDKSLRDWANRFLRDYRVNPEDPTSGFVRAFLPPPPRAPNIPLPAPFTPNPQEVPVAGAFPGAGGGAGFGDEFGSGGVTGEPVGNASSRYF